MSETLALAGAAETAGARSIWLASHLFTREPASLAGALLTQVSRVRVALMAVSPYVLHPAHATLITDDVLRHAACGTLAEVVARVEAYRAAGLDEVVLAGLREPDETRRILGAALVDRGGHR